MTKYSIYQVNSDRDTERVSYLSSDSMQNIKGIFEVKPEIYDKVYDGELDCNSLEDIYEKLNIDHPSDYKHRSLSVSDVVEIKEGSDIAPGFYFCNDIGFMPIAFDSTLTTDVTEKDEKTSENTMITVLKVEFGKAPKLVTIDRGLESLQNEVDGDIEQFMPFFAEVALIVNEEGKVRGLPLNRAVYDEDSNEMIDILSGDFLIVYAPHESEHYESLPENYVKEFSEKFKNPENFFRMNNQIVAIPYKPETEKDAR